MRAVQLFFGRVGTVQQHVAAINVQIKYEFILGSENPLFRGNIGDA